MPVYAANMHPCAAHSKQPDPAAGTNCDTHVHTVLGANWNCCSVHDAVLQWVMAYRSCHPDSPSCAPSVHPSTTAHPSDWQRGHDNASINTLRGDGVTIGAIGALQDTMQHSNRSQRHYSHRPGRQFAAKIRTQCGSIQCPTHLRLALR